MAALKNGQASHILLVTGTLDPWRAITFQDPANPPNGLTVFVVQHGTHCGDRANLQPNALLGVFEVHQLVQTLAKQWIANAQ